MHFTVKTDEINEAIAIVAKALHTHPNPSLGVIDGIFMHAYENRLFMKCCDLTLEIETEIPAEVEEEGKFIVRGMIFVDMLKRFNGEEIEFSTCNGMIYLDSGSVSFSIQHYVSDEYPEITPVKAVFFADITGNMLRSMIKQTLFCSCDDETKPVLSGACFKFGPDNRLVVVTLDGFRLAMRTETIKSCTGSRTVIVPGDTLDKIYGLIPATDEDITLEFSPTHISIDLGITRIASRLVDGEYVNYDNVLPKSCSTTVTIEREKFLKCIERVGLLVRDGASCFVRLSFKRGHMTLSASSNNGRLDDDIHINLIGKEIDMAFNYRYLVDAMRALEDEKVYLRMSNPMAPCVIQPIEGDRFYYMVLPVRTGG